MPIARIPGGPFFAVLISLSLFAQAPQKAPATPAPPDAQAAKPDYAEEPYVIELLRNTVRFENDGGSRRVAEVRIRVQSEAGVRNFGQLVFGYNSANEDMTVDSVEVRKADGTVNTAPGSSVQDLTAGVARDAPVYTDYRQKHVTVPGLRPGDILSFHVTTTTINPLAVGQFWFEHNFLKDAIVLDEELEINIPRGRVVKLKTQPGMDPAVKEEGARRIYRWKTAHTKRESEEGAAKNQTKKQDFADVQLTTFRNWAEVGQWYAALERDRAEATPAIRTKAQQLVGGRKTELEKIEGLYDYVARDFRYVSLSFGVGRYQPHAATEVLENQYGDCKDKHTLLQALVQAIGLRAFPVLASSSRKIDPDVPSPAQFDHVFTVIPTGSDEKSWIWLDTTTEVAPFRLLSASLRKKQVLVIPMCGSGSAPPAHLVETPADPPFPATQRVDVEGSVSELGKLTAKISYTVRGDTELVLRTAFRRTPRTQWKDLGRAIVVADGYRGEVTDVQASDPAGTEKPFHVEIQLSQPNFFDWSSRNSSLGLPLPVAGLPDVAEPDNTAADNSEPIEIGSPLELTTHLELTLPAGFQTQAPVPVSVSRDYADYSSTYKIAGGKLTAERILRFRMHELPAARARDYLAFARAVRSDEGQTLNLETASTAKPAIPSGAKPEELYEAAQAALQNSNISEAIELLNRVVELEPRHKSAWNDLGRAYFAEHDYERAAEAIRKQIEVNPYDSQSYLLLGVVLSQQSKFAEAEAAFRKQLEINPLDRQTHAVLGSILLEEHKYADAAAELERAVTLSPQSAELRVALGRAYLNLGKNDEAMAAFDKAVEQEPAPVIWNNIAYELAQKDARLDRAKQYAESAVATVAAGLRNASLAQLKPTDYGLVSSITAYWDTLGWVLFRQGDFAAAERFIRSAWLLGQHGEVGDHLGQVYAKQGRTAEATQAYAQALASELPSDDAKTHLAALAGGDDKVAPLVAKAKGDLSALRTIALGKQKWNAGDKDLASALFVVLLGPGSSLDSPPKVSDVKFLTGDEALRPLAESLRQASYPDRFPDATPTKLIRQGMLTCTAHTQECTFELLVPDRVQPIN